METFAPPFVFFEFLDFTIVVLCFIMNNMAMITAQQLNTYYDTYRNTEVAFTKDILKTLSLDPRQIYIKCSGGQWPCIINSSSLSSAKIIVGTKGGAYEEMAKPEPPVMNLRFYFYQGDKQTLSFFISCKVKQVQPYMNSNDLAIITLAFNQRPPDDFIIMLSHLIDANINSVKRKDERILINADSCRKLGIPKEEGTIVIDNVPRRCILRDISFGGAKVVVLGVAKFLVNKPTQLSLEFDDPHEIITLKGVVTDAVPVEGRKEIVATSIKYDENAVSLSYKIHINNYLTTTRKQDLDVAQGKVPPAIATPQSISPDSPDSDIDATF